MGRYMTYNFSRSTWFHVTTWELLAMEQFCKNLGIIMDYKFDMSHGPEKTKPNQIA